MTTSPPAPGAARVRGALLTGVHAEIIQVQATISDGPPGFSIPGVRDYDTCPIRDRVRAAILNSGLAWAAGVITVDLGPATVFRHGCGLDLPIAVAILTAAGTIRPGAAAGCVFAAELGLDGRLRPVAGIVPVLMTATAHSGPVAAVIAPDNWPEAAELPGITIAAGESLRQVAAWLRGERLSQEPHMPGPGGSPPDPITQPDLGPAGLGVPPVLRHVLEVSAAGGHHLCLTGPRGVGVPALAAGLAALLPDLSGPEAVEVTALHSAARLLGSGRGRVIRPPLRIPHHTATMAAMAGGGTGIRPGEAALAYGGVLCLDDAPEFGRAVLQALRQPLCDGEILLARGGSIARFPARFILLASMRPRPCDSAGCTCTPLRTRRYRDRVIGTLGAWIPLRVAVDPLDLAQVTDGLPVRDADAMSAARVAEARNRMRHRLSGTPWRLNGDIPRHELQRTYPPAGDGLAIIDHAAELGLIGNLGAGHITAVAWTLADLTGHCRPGAGECAQALGFWTGAAR